MQPSALCITTLTIDNGSIQEEASQSDLVTVQSIIEDACAEFSWKQTKGGRNKTLVSSLDQLSDENEEVDGRQVFVASDSSERPLFELESMFVSKNDRSNCVFCIQNSKETKFIALTITIVFRGGFDGSTYVPGKVAVEFKQLSEATTFVDGADDTSMEIPYQTVHEQMNTKEQLGLIVIQYETNDATIEDGLYEVTVTAEEDSNFSIALRGSFATDAFHKVKTELARCIQQSRKANDCFERALSLESTIQLLTRKFQLEERMLRQAMVKCDESESEIEKLELLLDERDEMEDAGAYILKRMQVLEVEYNHWRLVLDGR